MKLQDLSDYGVVDRRRSPSRLAETATNDRASAIIASALHERDYRHGRHLLEDLVHVGGKHLALICRDLELGYLDISRAVFLDTETTGLGMGAGTYVFLVGAGYLTDEGFHVKQFFLRGPGHEKRFLEELGEFLSGFSALVTFNGKSFDWPLLENRFILQRQRVPLRDPLHVDLLYAARRMWKRRLDSCGLASLEGHILDVRRSEEDLPGYLIPQAYFEYQITGNREPLQRVFYHNLQDILSVAALTIHIEGAIRDPHCGIVSHASDYVSLARAFISGGEIYRARECYDRALAEPLCETDRIDCLIGLATIHKRRREWDRASESWYRLLDEGGHGALFARVELAKYFEHIERDFLGAMDHVQYALEMTEMYPFGRAETRRPELEHRLSRLVNKAMRARHWSRAAV